MKLSDFYEVVEGVAPKRLSEEYCAQYEAYDNSGLLVDAQTDAQKALFSLDFSLSAVEKAIAEKATVIVTHHPAIYAKIGEIVSGDCLGNKLALCLKNGISVVSMHLNLDVAPGGIDECLAEGVVRASGGGESVQSLFQELLDGSGAYGGVYTVGEKPLDELAKALAKEFQSNRILVYPFGEKTVKRVASYCGAGASEEAIDFALQKRADVMISSDFKHHILAYAKERGLSVIVLTHYAAENYGFKKYYEKIRERVEIPCVYHEDEELL